MNVGFAKLTMDTDLGLSETAFGFGAGVFFLAYFLFEAPSNSIMDKVGARRWIARIMLTWGIVSGATAFTREIAQAIGLSAEHTVYLLRVRLGFAEAGFFPFIFFLTLWGFRASDVEAQGAATGGVKPPHSWSKRASPWLRPHNS